MSDKIETPNGFRGDYDFLSNFYVRDFYVKEFARYVRSGVHAFQAFKTIDPRERELVLNTPTPLKSKAMGRRVTLRACWDDVYRSRAMLTTVRQKFLLEDLAEKLLNTNGELVEFNYWHDTYFGCCTCPKHNGEGDNILGRVLMKVRDEIA